jgi:exodeoxyribonuclease V beta subunit
VPDILFSRPEVLSRIPKDGHCVIEASAGTGKTFTIEHLVLDLLLSTPTTLDSILVVTFTEKAAAELKERVRKLLEKALSGKSTGAEIDPRKAWRVDDRARERLERALAGFDAAHVDTIHAFCQRVLAEYAFFHQQLFEQKLVDGASAFLRAFRRALRTRIAREPALSQKLAAYLAEGSVDQLQTLLKEAHDKRYRPGTAPSAFDPAAVAAALHVLDERALIQDLASSALPPPVKSRLSTSLNEVIAGLRAGRSLAELPAVEVLTASRTKKDPPWWDRATLPTRRFLRLLHQAMPLEEAGRSRASETVDALLPVVEEDLAADKAARGQLDFDDMLGRLDAALSGPSGEALAAALRQRFTHGLIDEFQDTDDVQWRIFRKIFVEAEGRSLYLVGDPKQAIYGFRGGDVYTYLAATRELEERGASRVVLTDNYRSTAPLVEAINTVLDPAAMPSFFEGMVRYDHPVACGNPRLFSRYAGNEEPPVFLFHVTRGEDKLSAGDARQLLYAGIAEEIDRLLGKGRSQLTFGVSGDERALRASDIFVLTHRNNEGNDLARHLSDRGIASSFYKQEGLYQSVEASDLLMLLRGLAEPDDPSRRLGAFATSFLAVPWLDLPACRELPETHPVMERFRAWAELAARRDYARLFPSLLDDSGFAQRTLVLTGDERALARVQQMLEHLLRLGLETGLPVGELADRLAAYVKERATPEGMDGNVQRPATDRDAVQIMTVHKSKGLEAAVVFVCGGLSTGNSSASTYVVHQGFSRRVGLGKPAGALADRCKLEQQEEEQRLGYVGITRAKVRLYLPVVDDDALRQKPRGPYAQLNRRLGALLSEKGRKEKLFRVLPLSPARKRPLLRLVAPPGPALEGPLAIPDDPAPRIALARESASPLVMTSYSAIKRMEGGHAAPIEVDDARDDGESPIVPPEDAEETDALPRGRNTGRFLHLVLERLDFSLARAPGGLEAFDRDPRVDKLLAAAARRHPLDARHFPQAKKIVWEALTAPLELPPATRLSGLCEAEVAKEMEFLFPIPESAHPLLGSDREGTFVAERGFVKGFVDVVFQHQGRTYFADWKSDVLSDYSPASVALRVKQDYALQSRVYAVAIVRMLRLRDRAAYEACFGGSLFVFLRGLARGQGIVFDRPSWEDVVGYEIWLRDLDHRKHEPSAASP